MKTTKKNEIKELAQELLNSAKERDTNQGVAIYNKILELVKEAEKREDIDAILVKFNKALSGIEAHGYFTDDEYSLVIKLRELELE